MKKIFIILACSVLLVTGITFFNLNATQATTKAKTTAAKTVKKAVATGKSISNVKTFTLAQLKKYDGQNGKSAYVAVNGIVYDVTSAWGGGSHRGVVAGTDVSKAITRSPHGSSVLKQLPVVGKLVQ